MRYLPKLLLVATLILAGSCSGKKVIYEGTAEELDNQVVEELNKESGFPWIFGGTNYEKIFELLKEVQIRYPYTQYAAIAELRSGDVYFKKKDYMQAAEEYENFISEHPTHQRLDYAMYRLGLCYYNMKSGKDRNHSKSLKTIEWFTALRENYPDSPYVEQTKEKIDKAKEILAEREIYIGKFYQKKKNYKAAVERYENVLENYSDTKYSKEARELLKVATGKLQDQSP